MRGAGGEREGRRERTRLHRMHGDDAVRIRTADDRRTRLPGIRGIVPVLGRDAPPAGHRLYESGPPRLRRIPVPSGPCDVRQGRRIAAQRDSCACRREHSLAPSVHSPRPFGHGADRGLRGRRHRIRSGNPRPRHPLRQSPLHHPLPLGEGRKDAYPCNPRSGSTGCARIGDDGREDAVHERPHPPFPRNIRNGDHGCRHERPDARIHAHRRDLPDHTAHRRDAVRIGGRRRHIHADPPGLQGSSDVSRSDSGCRDAVPGRVLRDVRSLRRRAALILRGGPQAVRSVHTALRSELRADDPLPGPGPQTRGDSRVRPPAVASHSRGVRPCSDRRRAHMALVLDRRSDHAGGHHLHVRHDAQKGPVPPRIPPRKDAGDTDTCCID